MRCLAVIVLVVAGSCGGASRPAPTVVPLISATFLTVRLFTSDSGDGQERARLPGLRDSVAGALPSAWANATGGRGQLVLRTDADIDVELSGSPGTSVLRQHTRDGKIVSRRITVHTTEGGRRLSVPELMATTLHELGHIWCCYGPGATDGHWSDPQPTFNSVGLMDSPMLCHAVANEEPTCPSAFSVRELSEMRLTRAP